MESHRLFHSIHQLSRKVMKNINEVLQPYGLYSAQWSVIYTLKMKGTLTQKELCEYLAVEAPPMTRTIQRLMKQGYVQQTQGQDKRIKLISLTEKALKEFPVLEKEILKLNESMLESIPASSREQLYELITGWISQLEKRERE